VNSDHDFEVTGAHIDLKGYCKRCRQRS
jgi:Fe2+ or Zn2+ uptake regulation protein